MSTTPDHIPDAGKMMPTSEDYRFDLRFELALDGEAGYCPAAAALRAAGGRVILDGKEEA
jgi:hypothetical protein